jgi:hypothetical protein
MSKDDLEFNVTPEIAAVAEVVIETCAEASAGNPVSTEAEMKTAPLIGEDDVIVVKGAEKMDKRQIQANIEGNAIIQEVIDIANIGGEPEPDIDPIPEHEPYTGGVLKYADIMGRIETLEDRFNKLIEAILKSKSVKNI